MTTTSTLPSRTDIEASAVAEGHLIAQYMLTVPQDGPIATTVTGDSYGAAPVELVTVISDIVGADLQALAGPTIFARANYALCRTQLRRWGFRQVHATNGPSGAVADRHLARLYTPALVGQYDIAVASSTQGPLRQQRIDRVVEQLTLRAQGGDETAQSWLDDL